MRLTANLPFLLVTRERIKPWVGVGLAWGMFTVAGVRAWADRLGWLAERVAWVGDGKKRAGEIALGGHEAL